MTVERELRPRGPYSLALSARRAGDATRRFDQGLLTAALGDGESVVHALAWQRPDGAVVVRAASEAAFEQLRFVLAVDDDHGDFLRRFARDPLLGAATRRLAGLRPLRVPTVAHALLRALCGQLIETRRARALEGRIVRETAPRLPGTPLHASPACDALAHVAPARLRALGLHARRGAALARLCRSLDLERLRALPTDAIAARLGRERGIGPWSLGVIALEGLGRTELGLVGDLGLVKLLSALRGRRVEAYETAELLEPYGEWAGLASVYLLSAHALGLVPLRPGAAATPSPERFPWRAAPAVVANSPPSRLPSVTVSAVGSNAGGG